MFFKSDDGTPRLISNWRISMSSGQYAATSTLNYTGHGISPTETSYIWSKIRYTHGGSTKPQTIPRNLDLYVRTIGRIDLWVQVYSQYRYKDEYIDNTNTQTNPQSYHTYLMSEDILSPGSFPKFTLQRKGGNNTVQMWVNYNQFSTITTDSNVTFQKDGTTEEGTSFKFDNNEEITFKIHGLKPYQTQIYIVFQTVQASEMTIKLMVNNLKCINTDYTLTDVITEAGQGAYIGIKKWESTSSYEGPARITNAETAAALPYKS
jgi:hypothetical protein